MSGCFNSNPKPLAIKLLIEKTDKGIYSYLLCDPKEFENFGFTDEQYLNLDTKINKFIKEIMK